jgi:hypothetical protein
MNVIIIYYLPKYVKLTTFSKDLLPVFMLRFCLTPTKEELAGSWRRLHNEELRNLYASPNIVRMIRTRRMRWVGHVARFGDIIPTFLSENLKENNLAEDLSVDGKIILDRIDLREIRWEGVDWNQMAQDRDRRRALCEHRNENLAE